MPTFRQLGDPVAGAAACLCQHHGAAYAELPTPASPAAKNINYTTVSQNTAIISVVINTTERCCIVINAAAIINEAVPVTALEIERPIGTIRTTQEDEITTNTLRLTHHAAWEVLDPGNYTYYLMNRYVAPTHFYGAWIKAVASDCEG